MENLRTKAIELLLKSELENWIGWGRSRDWLPTSFKCVLGRLHIRERIPMGDERYDPNYQPAEKPKDISAAAFERVVIALPERLRTAFVAHHLDKAALNGRIVFLHDRTDRMRVLGIQKSQYHDMVNKSHIIVLRECQKIFAKNN